MHNWSAVLRRTQAGGWLAWLAWTVVAGVLLAHGRLNRLDEAFQTNCRIVHRLLSQTAAQHDAVLNTLAQLQPGAVGGDTPQARLPALFPQLIAVRRRGPEQTWPDAALESAEVASRALRRAVPAVKRVISHAEPAR